MPDDRILTITMDEVLLSPAGKIRVAEMGTLIAEKLAVNK